MALNLKQQRFVAEYLVDLNATQAAIRAGYSPKTAYSQAHDLLKKPEIADAVAAQGTALVEKAAGSAEWIVSEAVDNAIRAKEAKQYGAAASHLALLARRHPEFSEKHDVNVNERALVLQLVSSMSDEELRAAKARLTGADARA